MNKFKILILCFAFGLISVNAQNTDNEKLPNFVNAYVINSLNRNLDENAKLNCLHQYYVNIYKENNTFDILPKLVEKINEIEKKILGIGSIDFVDFTIHSTYNMFFIEEFDDSSTPYPKTIYEIETEIDNWLEKLKNETNWKQTFAIGKNLNHPKNDTSLDITKTRIIEHRFINYIFIKLDNAGDSAVDPYFRLLETIRRICNRFKIPVENFNQFVFLDYYDKFIGENKSTIKVRKYNTILKWALDTRNYRFLRGAIFIKEYRGKKVCNPYIDFTRIEIVDGEQESLLDFFDKVINHVGSTAVHDLGAVKDIGKDICACAYFQTDNEKYKLWSRKWYKSKF